MRRILILTVCAVAGALAAFVMSSNYARAFYLQPKVTTSKVNPPKVNPPKSFGGSQGSKDIFYGK